ncbi:MAG TPA: hypothetical protein PLB55_22420 [Prosthecobacter sp.]|nr:hypothetical protein [Prosthecobacter sp.]
MELATEPNPKTSADRNAAPQVNLWPRRLYEDKSAVIQTPNCLPWHACAEAGLSTEVRHLIFFIAVTLVSLLQVTGCSQMSIRLQGVAKDSKDKPTKARPESPLLKPHATRQQTRHDCGVASLEHAAKVWEVDIAPSISPEIRRSASSLASLADLAKKNGFEAFVLQGGSAGVNPYKEITEHLRQERPLILLLRIPPNIPDLISYVSAASRSSDFGGNPEHWARHFVVLTHALEIGENGVAKKFTLMDPSAGKYRTVDLQWLDLFWRRQDAKYLLIGR